MAQNYFGRGTIEKLVDALESVNADRLFLVTGKASYQQSGAKDAIDRILKNRTVTHFSDFSPNPTLEEAKAATALCEQAQADTIIAIGGGSAIDLAKTVIAINKRPDLATSIATGTTPVSELESLPLIAIPTTAGTGSEATHFAVIYVEGKKYSIASQALLPVVSILDPGLTDSLPPYLTACTGIDALCQAVESLWAVGANDESRSYAEQAIPLILENLPAAIHNSTHQSRDALLQAAYLAGQAINISKTTAPHALSYTITGNWKTPHGHAVALTLGAFITFHDSPAAQIQDNIKSADSFHTINRKIHKLLSADSAATATRNWYSFLGECGLSLAPNNLDIQQSATQIAQGVNVERLANHPVTISRDSLISILQSVPQHTQRDAAQ